MTKVATLFAILLMALPLFGDTIEFNNGAKLNGTIAKVDDTSRSVTINMTVRGRSYTRRYAFKDIRSITQNGQTRSLSKVTASKPATASSNSNSRSEQEIRRLGRVRKLEKAKDRACTNSARR